MKACELHSSKLVGYVVINNDLITIGAVEAVVKYCQGSKLQFNNLEQVGLVFEYFGITEPKSVKMKQLRQKTMDLYKDFEQRRKEYQYKLFNPISSKVLNTYELFLESLNDGDFYDNKAIDDWTTIVVLSSNPQYTQLKFELSIGAKSIEMELDHEGFEELFKVLEKDTSRDRCCEDLFCFVCGELGYDGEIELVKGCRRWEFAIPP